MGKKAKRKVKNKNAIDKSKYVSVKKKGVIGKLAKLASKNSSLKSEQKDLKKQGKVLRKGYTTLAAQYKGVEKEIENLLKQISQLQLESQEIKGSLAAEMENTAQIRDQIDTLESREGVGQEQVNALNRQMEQHVRQVDEVRSQLEAVGQIEYLQDGKAELESRISKLVTEMSGLKSGNSSLGSSIESLSARLDEAIKRLEQSLGQDQVAETEIGNLNRTDSDLSLRIDQQHERIQGLAERAEKLDQIAHKTANFYQALQQQIGDLREGLVAAEEHRADKDAELEKKSRHLESEYQRLAVKHGRLSVGVLVAGLLLLFLGGVGYWVKFSSLEQKMTASSQQVERISDQMEQQDRKLVNQEQRVAVLQDKGKEGRSLVAGEWDARFERIKKGQDGVGARLAQYEEGQETMEMRLEQFSQDQDAMEARVKSFTNEQNEITVKLMRLGEERNEMDRQLEQTRSLHAELVTEQAEWQTITKQQGEKLRSIEELLQKVQAQMKVAGAPTTADKVRNSSRLQGLDPKHYTIQIFAAYDSAVVSRIAAREDLREVMAIYKGEFNQRDWYILLYGDFSSVREARSASLSLPEDIRVYGPWVRNLSTVQGDLVER